MSEHAVYETIDGHEWCRPNDFLKWDYCKRCLKIRRADKKNPPCKGPGKLRAMESPPPPRVLTHRE